MASVGAWLHVELGVWEERGLEGDLEQRRHYFQKHKPEVPRHRL